MKIKICGITNIKEAEYLNQYKADMAGMVLFFEKSKRNISLSNAKCIIGALNSDIATVAVTVKPNLDMIKEIENAGFDYIQIHGDVAIDIIRKINIPVLKAFNVTDINNLEYYDKEENIAGYVFDAEKPGSGKVFDYEILKKIDRSNKLFILAGGLNPDNICEIINEVNPDVVDVSSGVENDNGIGKDKDKIKLFINNARKCKMPDSGKDANEK